MPAGLRIIFDFVMESSRQYFPGIDGCDGFFIARFKKKRAEGENNE